MKLLPEILGKIDDISGCNEYMMDFRPAFMEAQLA